MYLYLIGARIALTHTHTQTHVDTICHRCLPCNACLPQQSQQTINRTTTTTTNATRNRARERGSEGEGKQNKAQSEEMATAEELIATTKYKIDEAKNIMKNN